MITSLLNGAKKKYKDESKDKGGDTENTPPPKLGTSWECVVTHGGLLPWW